MCLVFILNLKRVTWHRMWPAVLPWHVKLKNMTSIVVVLASQIVLGSKCAFICQPRGRKAAVSSELNICSLLTHIYIIMSS